MRNQNPPLLWKLAARPFFCAAIAVTLLLLAQSLVHPASRSTDPIRIILNNWTSQILLAKILGKIYEHHGYVVEYSEVDIEVQWSRLHHGLDHIQVEVWEGTMAKEFQHVLKYGNVFDAGTHSAKTREEWWYPLYVEEACPGLPDWKALRDCASLFSESPSSDVGRYIAGPWEKPEKSRIWALKMRFSVDVVEKADDLWVELKKAHATKKPIVLFNWTPNWIEDRFEGRFIEFPPYDPKCESDASWGINKEQVYDCGNPKDGWLKKAAWSGLHKNWPCAARVLKDMNFSNLMISNAAAMVDADGLSVDQAVEKWMSNHQKTWRKWGSGVCS